MTHSGLTRPIGKNWGAMMANRALALNSYQFSPQDELFFDANVWLFLYGPGPSRASDKRIDAYSVAFKKILAVGCRIFIDVVIVSEFINRYARLQWDASGKPGRDFKGFRKSGAFQPIAQNIAAAVRQILKHCQRVESGFEGLDMNTLLAGYAVGDVDFNDQIIAELCQSKGLTLVTDDGDFAGQNIPVLTANKRLLTRQT